MSISEYLEVGDDGYIAVQAQTKEQARALLERITEIPNAELRVQKIWMEICSCETCEEEGPMTAHGYDEYWVYCAKDAPGAVEWWVMG